MYSGVSRRRLNTFTVFTALPWVAWWHWRKPLVPLRRIASIFPWVHISTLKLGCSGLGSPPTTSCDATNGYEGGRILCSLKSFAQAASDSGPLPPAPPPPFFQPPTTLLSSHLISKRPLTLLSLNPSRSEKKLSALKVSYYHKSVSPISAYSCFTLPYSSNEAPQSRIEGSTPPLAKDGEERNFQMTEKNRIMLRETRHLTKREWFWRIKIFWRKGCLCICTAIITRTTVSGTELGRTEKDSYDRLWSNLADCTGFWMLNL